MTERSIMKWYKDNLLSLVEKAIEQKKIKTPDLIYTADWLLAIAFRETWTLVSRYHDLTFENMKELIKGDYSNRPGDPDSYRGEKSYHGFGFWQIDTGSYPDFVKTGYWKDPFKCCCKAIDVLEEKRRYLSDKLVLTDPDAIHRSITAAYNCGQGNVVKAIRSKLGVDYYTHEKNYSAMVWKYRELYNLL